MWLATTAGFFSVVEDREDEARLLVRARVRQDLVELKRRYAPDLGPIVRIESADYPYRASITRASFAAAVWKAVQDVRYDNFKNEIARQLCGGRERAGIYTAAWSAFRRLTAALEGERR